MVLAAAVVLAAAGGAAGPVSAAMVRPGLVRAFARAAGAARSEAALHGIHVFGWGFTQPRDVALDGTHVWVASKLGPGSVTELDASSGAFVREIAGPASSARAVPVTCPIRPWHAGASGH